MSFQLRPTIYSLLLCSSVREDKDHNGWIVQPFSEISVTELPYTLALTLFAQIMAPPGSYDLALRLFHTADPDHTAIALPPRTLNVQEGKNLDYVLHVEIDVTRPGLYVLEAALNHDNRAVTPMRVSLP